MNVTVHYNKLPIAPRKIRAILGNLKTRTVADAIALVAASPRSTAEPIRKLLLSSISAAHDRNPALKPDQLTVSEIFCNEAARIRRTRRKSRGRASSIAKRGSHLTLTIAWTDTPKTATSKKKVTQATKRGDMSNEVGVMKPTKTKTNHDSSLMTHDSKTISETTTAEVTPKADKSESAKKAQ